MDPRSLRALRQVGFILLVMLAAYFIGSGLNSVEPVRAWAAANEVGGRIMAVFLLAFSALLVLLALSALVWLKRRYLPRGRLRGSRPQS